MGTEGAQHDARLVPGVSFLFETECGKYGRAKLLDLLPWSDHPYKVEWFSELGKHIESFKLSDFKRILLMPTGFNWAFLSSE